MCKLYRGPDFDAHDYYIWLCDLVNANGPEHEGQYSLLLKTLHETEFVWSIANDDNRAIDGKELRERYADETGQELTERERDIPCSVLEMLIALSFRCERDIMGEPGEDLPDRWFWIMIKNLKLDICTDDCFDRIYVDQQIDLWLMRQYKRNGVGGLFPLLRPDRDQRKVEIWFQLCSYINENYSLVV